MAGENKISTFMMAIIVFTIFISGVIYIIGNVSVGYSDNRGEPTTFIPDDGTFTDFQTAFNKTETLNNSVTSLGDILNNPELSLFGKIDLLFSKGVSVVKSVGTLFSFVPDMIFAIPKTFSFIPSWLPVLIALALSSFIIFAILSAIFQREL